MTDVNTKRHLTARPLRPLLLVFCCLLPGCLFDNRNVCAPVTEHRSVVLKVVDAATGQDITESGEAGGAEFYLFSPEGDYAGHFALGEAGVADRTPVAFSGRNLGGSHLSVWTNTDAGQHLHELEAGDDMGDRAISLIDGGDGYHGSPDDLFFGRLRLAQTAGDIPEELTLFRKNSRMRITVRGLDGASSPDRYYLTVQMPNDGYDFRGEPMEGQATVRKEGEFDEHGDFSTTETFNMIHTDHEALPADVVTVALYETDAVRSADRQVFSVTVDDDGLPIALPAGETVNLLIDLTGTTGLSVQMEVTPWNEIYLWEIW